MAKSINTFPAENAGTLQESGLRLDYLPLSSLKAAKRNPKKHSVNTVIDSINRFGYVSPMIVNERTGALVAGHGRLESLKKMKNEGRQLPSRVKAENGEWLVPVIRGISFSNDEEAEAYLLTDNQTSMLGGWHEAELKEILESLATDVGLIGTGFEDFFQTDIQEDDPGPLIDNAANLQKKWGTAIGQLWSIGAHRLLCGNSTIPGDVERLMNRKRAGLFATDPPYLVAYDGTNHPHKWKDSATMKRRKNKDWSDKYTDVDNPELDRGLYDMYLKIAVEVAIAPNAAWYGWHASRRQALLESIWEKYGAFVHQQIIWVKDRPILNRSWYMWQHEPCFFGWVKGHKPKRFAKDYPSSIWSFPTQAPGQSSDHPTQKPIELFAIPMRQHTEKGDICYEPFSGSGTQLVAAEMLGRTCYAMELSPPFVAVALERLSLMGLKPILSE